LRVAEAAESKDHIAAEAARLLRPAETVVLDGGSTVLAIARALRGKGLGLTVVTPSLLVAFELSEEPDTTVLMPGGEVRPGELILIGSETEEAYSRYNCDTYVMGVAGIDALHGVTDYHRRESSAKRAALASVDRVIVAADASKLGRVLLVNIAPVNHIDVVVTDAADDHPLVGALREAGVEVLCVPAA
jgi:DeoR/GlpR family transcriptional regulator of sugar metabolism